MYAKLFVESQDIFRNQKKFVTDRVLLALGVNPYSEYSLIGWNEFLRFKRVLVAKSAPVPEMVNFVIQVRRENITCSKEYIVFES